MLLKLTQVYSSEKQRVDRTQDSTGTKGHAPFVMAYCSPTLYWWEKQKSKGTEEEWKKLEMDAEWNESGSWSGTGIWGGMIIFEWHKTAWVGFSAINLYSARVVQRKKD